jgi:thiamine kinase-like enzyme
MSGPLGERESAECLSAQAAELLRRAGIDCCNRPAITRLSGGGNNGVFRVDLPERAFILKQYFSHPEDPRDRFGTETAFVDYLWRNGIRVIPELLASSAEDKLALYRFIEGRRLTPSEVGKTHVDQAAQFCLDLFRLQALPGAQQLPTASEACFSIQDHLACLERRIAALSSIEPASRLHVEAYRFVKGELLPCWEPVRRHVEERMTAMGVPADQVLSPKERVLSPSDFGFHNALLTDSGSLCFFDFEYAGWDDPAKLVCDFFCQVEVPAPRSLMPRFVESLPSVGAGAQSLAERVECLFPVYVLKWCAIVLNDFVPVASARRQFSAASPPSAERLELQLVKARRLLHDIEFSS